MKTLVHTTRTLFAAAALICALAATSAHAQPGKPDGGSPYTLDRTILPIPEPKPAPITELDARNAKAPPRFEVKAPAKAPNVIIILIDDMGFGQPSAFGGPVHMPTLEKMAKGGLSYNQFHTTALCSPTRAALLTGRNHHVNNMGSITETATSFPGQTGQRPNSVAPLAEMLRLNGYSTSAYGKSHETAAWEVSPSGPTDRWPTRSGFDHFYGFIGGETNQWAPAIYEDMSRIEVPRDPHYNFMTDMTNQAIKWMQAQKSLTPDRPFFIYFAPGATHAPHHVPKEWIAKYKGQFDQGWDKVREETFARQKKLGLIPASAKLTQRSEGIPAWDSLNPDQKRLFAHMMEVYAAALSHCDYQMGRILDAIQEMGVLDNTLVIYIQGDNGASGEGGMNGLLNEMTMFNAIPEDYHEVLRRMDELGSPTTFNHYPVGWAHAMDTPFQWTKQIASHFGGTRNGMVISWPARIKDKGGIRTQFCSVIDIAPTILEAAGVPVPSSINGVAQKPIEGVSLAYTFDNRAAPSKHTTQYFEMFANRGIYHDGWVACTTPPIAPWVSVAKPIDINDYKWELYNVAEDFTEADNLAEKNPGKLHELQALFWKEAEKYSVLPIDNSRVERFDVSNRPSLTRGREEFTYYPGMVRIPEGSAPDLKNKSFQIKAEVDIPPGGAEGMLLTHGGRFSGYGFYLLKGRPVFHYNLAGVAHYSVAAQDALTPGKHTILFDFKYDGGLGKGGTGTILVDGKKAAEGRIDRTLPFRLSLDETLDCGEDTGTAVCEDYHVPFKFTGDLKKVTIDLTPRSLSAADDRRLKQGKVDIRLSE